MDSTMTSLPGSLLVVDDDEANRDMLSRRLVRKGYDVLVAEDGSRAIDLVRQRPFDLVLLDVVMPGLSGLEVLQVLREAHPATELPVIMATARNESGDVVEALRLGANDYVSKPLDFPVVLARIQAQLSLKRAVEEVVRLERSLAERNRELEQANARLAEANRRMGRDLRAAAKIQATFLPRAEPDLPGARFAWHYRPCDELAGDGLNVFALDRRHAALYVFDVSGHGVASALLSVSLSRVLSPPPDPSSVLGEGEPPGPDGRPMPPAEVAARLNRMFPFDEATGQFFTMVYGVLDVHSGEFRYVSAGHPGLAYLPAAEPGRIVERRGFPIGLAEVPYEEHSLTLRPGDRLYLYSDGLVEALDTDSKVFGGARLLRAIERVREDTLERGVATLLEEVQRWTGAAGLRDDASLVAVEFLGAAAEPGPRILNGAAPAEGAGEGVSTGHRMDVE
jgi:sigma-B regulation protein RsbU (phosphoserine phosphatase)